MDTEMPAPTAAPAMATVIIEPENLPRMIASFCHAALLLLQRIRISASRRVVLGQRIGSASLGKLAVFLARRLHHRRKAKVSFNAARLVINSVFLFALPGELLLGGPRTCPHGRIFDGDDVFERAWPGSRPALDQVQVLARAPIIGFRTEVRHVDDER